jgi:hypothetical protein
MWYRDMSEDDLVALWHAAMVLNVRLQAVVKLGMPRYMVAKNVAYKKRDIETLLAADRLTPNVLLRELQEAHRQVQIRQKAEPSRRYKRVSALSQEEANAAREKSKTNREKPPTKDEIARDPWLALKLRRFR